MPSWNVDFGLPLELHNPQLLMALARAEALAETIRRIPVAAYVRARLDRLNIARAVRGTTAIEGAVVSEEEVGRVLDSSEPVLEPARQRDEQEVRNADAANKFISSLLDSQPDRLVTEGLICRINEMLTQGIDYSHHTPGHYRSHGVTAATYSAPRPEEVVDLMAGFVRWLNSGDSLSWPRIARAIAAHFFLVSIHPFGDGNGRTARAVESFLLYQARINVFGFYSLSNFYYRSRETYIDKLDEVRFEARSLTPFILFAAIGLAEELETVHSEVLAYIARLVAEDDTNDVLRRAKISSRTRERLAQFMQQLREGPVALRDLRSGKHVLARLYAKASVRTIERDIDQLETLGLLRRENSMLMAQIPNS